MAVQTAHIADIGSGDVYVLRYISESMPSTRFIAVDTAYTTDVIRSLQSQPFATNIEFHSSMPVTSIDKADVLLLMDVLEHCEDDRKVLKEAISAPLAKDGAFVLITVPAFQSVFSQHDTLLKHYRRYSRTQLNELATSQGLTVINSGYFFFSLLPARILQKLMEKMNLHKTKTSIDNWKGNKAITKIISAILWTDFRICRALSSIGLHLPGLSCYCLCKKSPS